MKNSIVKKTIKILFISLLFLGVFSIFKIHANAGELNMHAINIGHGDAILFESQGHYMLVDSGEADNKKILMNYLSKFNIPNNTLDYAVATHADQDHLGGFHAVINKYAISNVVYSEPMKDTKTFSKFEEAIKSSNVKHYATAYEKQTWKLGDATIRVIYDGRKGTTYNESSIVFKIMINDRTILMTGDLPTTMEKKLMSKGYNFKADILKVAHHGAAASTSMAFLNHVNPKYAVIPSGYTGKTFLPKDSVLQRLAIKGIKTYLTTEGHVVLKIKNGIISTSHKVNTKFIGITMGKVSLKKKKYYAPKIKGKTVCPKFKLYVNGVLVSKKNYTVTYSHNKHVGVGKITITGNKTKYVGTLEKEFSILPGKVNVYSAVRAKRKIKIKWSKISHCSGYEIQCSTKKSFKPGSTIVIIKGKKKSATIKGLKKHKHYYVRVRGLVKNGDGGKWSRRIKL